MKNMKKWKIIQIITISILCIFLFFSIFRAITVHNRNTIYPYETLGAITVNNWIEAFGIEMCFALHIFGLPLIIDIILIIISTIKMKEKEK